MMFQFVYWLKAIAAICITNSHYGKIWPVSAMAFGGHLGNCLFFLVSGFCLCHVKNVFPKWYLKRIVRIYPPLWVALVVNILFGFFHISSVDSFVHYFFYPTCYHFINSIMILYVLYYLVRTLQCKFRLNTRIVVAATLAVCVIVYVFFFDKSWYHIDSVEETWVRYQFWICMMLGAYLQEQYKLVCEKITSTEWAGLVILFALYFAAKVLVSRYQMLSAVQFLSPLTLVILVYRIALIAIKLEKKGFFAALGKWNRPANFLASITLEVYLIQNVIIHNLAYLPFPVNFVVVTALIIAVAWPVHQIAEWMQKKIGLLINI